MDCTLLLVYALGWFIAFLVIQFRAGLGWHGHKLLGEGGLGIEFLFFSWVAMMFWPVTLVVWLARGRPEPRIVFGDKAEERRRRAVKG
ncbi:hypothetical protein [Micromonospora tulbaghiae]|uniref:hypothetical protein n=1 Tax=Micromonospora tulbaghiae TaxID=479978 RepID=UPI0036ADD6A7